VWIKSEHTAGVAVSLPAWKQYVLGAGQTGSGWGQFSTEFVQGNGSAAFVYLYNDRYVIITPDVAMVCALACRASQSAAQSCGHTKIRNYRDTYSL